jgi:uncharacterized membrane protein YkvI
MVPNSHFASPKALLADSSQGEPLQLLSACQLLTKVADADVPLLNRLSGNVFTSSMTAIMFGLIATGCTGYLLQRRARRARFEPAADTLDKE